MLGTVCLAWFLVLLDDTAAAIALPSLGRDLGLGLAGLEWVVNIYTLSFAVLTLWGGMLADRLGARPVFLAGLAAFVAFSLASGLAPTGGALIGMRAGQGAGAALMGPAALALLCTSFTGPRQGMALGVWSGVGATALAIGPLLGAVLTDAFGWRSPPASCSRGPNCHPATGGWTSQAGSPGPSASRRSCSASPRPTPTGGHRRRCGPYWAPP
ncbi:hypothetical protein GCM10018777_10960 [Streptomyces albogriseolus]|nr:hypothetical protein GCM10018777_10960 [Streptomyces viridodiastaticus]